MASQRSFVMDFVNKENSQPNSSGHTNLQDAFAKFRKDRKADMKRRMESEQKSREEKCDPIKMETLRGRFVEQAKKYIGVPYAKRYHEPDSPTFHSKLFLDCCGLVRKCMKDLESEFGFRMGPWNQAYQYDTLPIKLSGPSEMKPGDLVFVSAIYNCPRKKKQKHSMVHVEIWLGEEEKTIGARWQKRFVEIHDSYTYVSKSYHSMEYHFRSIDTWLQGICKSFCPEHPWLVRSKYKPGKHSIFCPSDQQQDAEGEASDQEENPPIITGDQEENPPIITGDQEKNPPLIAGDQEENPSDNNTCDPSDHITRSDNPSSSNQTPDLKISEETGSPFQHSKPKQIPSVGNSSPSGAVGLVKSKSKVLKSVKVKFYIGGNNGANLVDQVLVAKGWERIRDKQSTDFFLKWVEIKSQIHYGSFKEGCQIVNHFPNIGILTTKVGLLDSLRNYSRLHSKVAAGFDINNFYPETFRLDVMQEREDFTARWKAGDKWICKPNGQNQGKGIFLVESVDHLLDVLKADDSRSTPSKRSPARIVQCYIEHPLLLNGRKFDIRSYMLLVSGYPYVVLYHPGYLRLACERYSLESKDLSVHLTNQYVQKKREDYQHVKEDTVWSYQQFQQYLDDHHSKEEIPENWVEVGLKDKMKKIMLTCFQSVQRKLQRKLGFFDLLGFDFMIDENFKVWLIEINVNPALHTNCEVLQGIIPKLVHNTIDVAVDVFERCKYGKALPPLAGCYGDYELISK